MNRRADQLRQQFLAVMRRNARVEVCHSRIMAECGLTSSAVRLILAGAWTPDLADVRALCHVWGASPHQAVALFSRWQAAEGGS